MAAVKTDVIGLKKIMVEKRLDKVNALCEEAGINRGTLYNILAQKTQPSSAVIQKLIFALDIPPSRAGEIFFGQNYLTSSVNT